MLHYTIENLTADSPAEWLREKELHKNKMGLYAFLGIDAEFTFCIDNVCVLKEPHWNIGELAKQLVFWLKTGLTTDFYYSSLEAEEESLFTFKKSAAGFVFSSEWEEVHSNAEINTAELERFILGFQLATRDTIRRDLGLDVSYYL